MSSFVQLLILTGIFLAFHVASLVVLMECLDRRAKREKEKDRLEMEAMAKAMAANCHEFHRELNRQTLIGFEAVVKAMDTSTKVLTEFMKRDQPRVQT